MTRNAGRSYRLTTHWRLPATVPAVWDAIRHSEQWPSWWPSVQSVTELAPGDESGVGNLRRYRWRGLLPYALVFDIEVIRIEKYRLIEGMARGELFGMGRWVFSEQDGGSTCVRHDWNVETTSHWMNLLAPLARPIFEWNHTRVMQQGQARLKQRLEKKALSPV